MNRSEKRREIWKIREFNNLCIYCGVNLPYKNKKGCKDCLSKKAKKTSEFSKNNRGKINQYNLRLKHEVIEKYGNKCNCCNESQIHFLTIDHKNNDGNIERKSIKNYNTLSFYLKLKRENLRSDIQILCFNCNLGKSINGGVCPHIEVIKKLGDFSDGRRTKGLNIGTKIDWPTDDDLIRMCNESCVSNVAKLLSVDFSTISGRLKRRNKYHLVNKNSGKKIIKNQKEYEKC